MKISALRPLIALACLTFAPLIRAAEQTPAAALDTLMRAINAKQRQGVVSEETLLQEIAEFDVLLQKFKERKTDDVAEILFMKGLMYFQLLKQPDKAMEILEQVSRDFPGTRQVARAKAYIDRINRLTPAEKAQIAAQAEADKIQQYLQVGKDFPDFAVKDTAGQPLSVSQYKGKVVLIDFWAMWCGPCIAELPNVVKTYDRFHAQGFDIIGVSLDREGEGAKLAQFTKDNKMPWAQFFDGKFWKNELAVKYGIHAIPATYLIGPDGKIIAKNLRGDALAAAVSKALAAK